MRQIISTILLLSVLFSFGQTIPKDKQLHFIAGTLIGAGVTEFCALNKIKHPALWGIGAGFLAGVGKEIYDKQSGKGTPEFADAVYTILGATTVSVTIQLFNNYK
jgi:hypothetical protein